MRSVTYVQFTDILKQYRAAVRQNQCRFGKIDIPDPGAEYFSMSAFPKSIGDKAYGNMLLGISGGKEQTQRALDYLGSIPDIFVEEVKQ